MTSGALVVAVSGTSGAGKSTLVGRLSARLRALSLVVETLHFDDFAAQSDLPDDDIAGWLARGAQAKEWRTDEMVRRLLALRSASSGPSAASAPGQSPPATVVVVEEPFGRARPPFDRLVDLSIHLRVPLHLALARALLRQYVPPAGGMDDTSAAGLRRYLTRYLENGAELYAVVDAAAAQHADLVLDGLQARAC